VRECASDCQSESKELNVIVAIGWRITAPHLADERAKRLPAFHVHCILSRLSFQILRCESGSHSDGVVSGRSDPTTGLRITLARSTLHTSYSLRFSSSPGPILSTAYNILAWLYAVSSVSRRGSPFQLENLNLMRTGYDFVSRVRPFQVCEHPHGN
jgi:hypothetical protein